MPVSSQICTAECLTRKCGAGMHERNTGKWTPRLWRVGVGWQGENRGKMVACVVVGATGTYKEQTGRRWSANPVLTETSIRSARMDKPTISTFPQEAQDRFFQNFPVLADDECWEWRGYRNTDGYGLHGALSRRWVASRLALEIKLGRKLGSREFACHTCDNPPCVNPAHLWAGSNSDNIRDAISKGVKFGTARRGEDGPAAKLTEDAVRRIWAARGEYSASQICREFGVGSTTISAIWSGQTWSSVTCDLGPLSPPCPTTPLPGDKNPAAKLTDGQVREIFAAKGKARQIDLAERYGVSQPTISRIQRGDGWQHIIRQSG